jgi:hypothetical protein
MVNIFDAGENGTAWGGRLILSREFYNPATGDYLALEAHECQGRADQWLEGEGKPPAPADGSFLTALWVPQGNNGGDGIPTELHALVKWMQDYPVPEGMIEGTIPEMMWR